MKKISPIIFILFIFFLYLIISHFFIYPLENLDTNTTPTSIPSSNPSDIQADVEANSLVHHSSDEISGRQYVVDRLNHTFTESDNKLLVRSHQRSPTTPYHTEPPTSSAITVQDNLHNNLDFNNNLENWKTTYYPNAIIGPNGIGLKPFITIKSGKDSYGFTFTKNYLQIQFTGYSQYNFGTIIPHVLLQTSLQLTPGNYQLKYNIQTRPNISIDTDSRSIGIMSMANAYQSPPFLFYAIDQTTANKKRVPFLSDETLLTPQVLNFSISHQDSFKPTILTFVFGVTDPTITDNCTVALGDIEIINCGYNVCT